MSWVEHKDAVVETDDAGNKTSHGPTPGDLPCPRCLHPIRIGRPTFGSLRWCEKCNARLGISAVQTFCSLKLMPDQFGGEKKYRNKKPTKTRAETLEAMKKTMTKENPIYPRRKR